MPTHLIGAALLRGEWKAAVSLILDPREGDILCYFTLSIILLLFSLSQPMKVSLPNNFILKKYAVLCVPVGNNCSP